MKTLKLIGKILLSAVACVLVLAVLTVGGLNVAKYGIYKEFYSIRTNICKNPGLSDGFVCQGIAADEENEIFLVSGYMKDKSASRIYITNEQNDSYHVSLVKGGEDFTGHAGGIAVTRGTVYLASGKRIYSLPLSVLLEAEAGEVIEIGEGVRVNNSASFVFTDEEYLYVGEFHDGGAYQTSHTYMTPSGENNAIISRYKLGKLDAPDRIYSIPDKVQGVAFTPDGKIVFSTSYGITDSVYYVYDASEIIPTEHTLDGAPVYFLGECIKKIKGPAMSEDLDWYEGRVISLSESASDKYIFGKLFFANKIYGLDYNG